jgi:hypothetical protein
LCLNGITSFLGRLVATKALAIASCGNCQREIRGGDPADIQRLVETFKRKLASAPDQNGLVTEIDVFTDLTEEVKNDSAFLPPMVLGLDGDLFIHAPQPRRSWQVYSGAFRLDRGGRIQITRYLEAF